MIRHAIVAAILAVLASPVFAQPREKVLLPVFFSGEIAGGYGSRWSVELTGYNAGSRFVRVGGPNSCGIGTCPFLPALPRSFFRITGLPPLRPNAHAGYFYYVDSLGAEDVSLYLRVHDLSRQLSTWGTQVPVVRRADTFSDRLHLVNVPRDQGFRNTLRIYEFDLPVKTADVTVRVLDATDNTVLLERDTQLTTGGSDPNEFPPQVIINEFLSELGPGGPTIVEVIPRTPGSAIWAYLSVTHNETQHVTTVTPTRSLHEGP
jgi:hypothetical protein